MQQEIEAEVLDLPQAFAGTAGWLAPLGNTLIRLAGLRDDSEVLNVDIIEIILPARLGYEIGCLARSYISTTS